MLSKNKSSFGVNLAFQLLKFSVFCCNFVLNKTQINMKMSNTGLKTTCVLALLVMLFTACGHSSYNSQLAQVDSLLTATQYEQADSLLKLCDPSNYNTQDRKQQEASNRPQTPRSKSRRLLTPWALTVTLNPTFFIKQSQQRKTNSTKIFLNNMLTLARQLS